jgi:anti-sigma regulatory factor (Ser/Thr protein kinase)
VVACGFLDAWASPAVEPAAGQALPDFDWRFEHSPRAAADARDALRASLHGLPKLGDVVLVASELVSNVFNHTHDGGELKVWRPNDDGRVRVEVHDTDPKLPEPAETTAVGGHGLTIVDAVADEWGTARTPDGKVVWVQLASSNTQAHAKP